MASFSYEGIRWHCLKCTICSFKDNRPFDGIYNCCNIMKLYSRLTAVHVYIGYSLNMSKSTCAYKGDSKIYRSVFELSTFILKVLFLATGQKFRPNTDKSHKLRTICCHISTWVYERQLGIFIRTNISERIAQLFPTNIEDNLKGELDQTNTQETTCRWFINNTHTHIRTHAHTHAHTHTHTAEVSDSDVDSFQCLMN